MTIIFKNCYQADKMKQKRKNTLGYVNYIMPQQKTFRETETLFTIQIVLRLTKTQIAH